MGVRVTAGVSVFWFDPLEFFVINSHIILKADELILPLKNLYQSPSLLQISIIPVLALDLKSICPSDRKIVKVYANFPYYFDLIFYSSFIIKIVFRNASLMAKFLLSL